MTLVELCMVGVLCVLVTAMTVDQRRRDALGVGTLQGDMRLLAPVWSEAHHYGISSNTMAGSDSSTSHSDWAIPMSSMYQCQYPGCQKESAFDPNTGAQNEYCLEHIQYTQMLQQASYNAFTTPRWSVGNTDSSDIASSQSDSSDDDQDLSSRVQSDGGSVRPTTSAAAPSLSSSSTNWGVGLASAFTSLFQSQTQRAPSKKTRPQHVSPRKRTQSAGPATAQARPVTAPSQQVHQSITMPQATFMQAQQSILVPQTIPGEINIH